MSLFVALGVLLVGGALAFAVWPFVRRREAVGADKRREDNLALYRHRMAELEAERAAGSIAAEDFDAVAEELAAALLEDVQDEAEPAAALVTAGPRWLPLTLALVLPLLTVIIYARLGAGADWQLAGAADLLRSPVDRPVALAELVARLEDRVSRNPGDADSAFLLGHARMRERNFAAAAASFERVIALRGNDPNTLVSLIQAQFLADGGRISETNRTRVEQLLGHIPNQPLVLEMLAMDAAAAGAYARAAGYLEQALGGGVGPAQAAALRAELARVQQLGGLETGPALDVTVAGLGAVGDLPAEAVVYVIARRHGERMPRMVARSPVSGDRVRVRLDATTVMGQQAPLQAGESLEVVARLSRTGDVSGGPGAVETVSGPLTLEAGTLAVQVELGAEPTAARVPAQREVLDAAVTIALSAADAVQAAPETRVYVIARPVSGPPMPVAVRALTFADLPLDVQLSDQDAMAPGRELSAFDEVVVVARLSRSGSPMKQPGDVESEVVTVTPTDRPAVALQLR